ncbi:MAG: AraC family transcriptional regulator [Acutalibacteraceae bacterium]|nr:AraC family transcriptional regulator [Acutalibacteraceae bacterium]
MKLKLSDIHPFVRRAGVAFDMVQERFLKSYDHRLFIPLTDGGFLEVADDYYVMSPTKAYLISPDVKYRVKLAPKQEMIVVNFDWTMNNNSHYDISLSNFTEVYNESQITEKVDWSDIFERGDYLVLNMTADNLELAHALVEKYLSVCSRRSLRTLQLSGIFMQMIANFLDTKIENEPRANQIYKFICKNYNKPLTLEMLSKEFHFHPTYINRLLTKQYGKSFKQLLIRVRLKQSVYLLDDPSLSINEIAEKLGFFDYNHFRQSFRKYYGITPAQYRRR